MYDLVLGHTCFMGRTGYANHARNFFTALNELIPVGIESTTVDDTMVLSPTQHEMLSRHTGQNVLHIVLECTNHPIFYADIPGPKIAYNVWESTRQPDEFFARLLEYDQLWVPSEWQRQCSIDQGYPEERVKVVHEGVDRSVFAPNTDRFDKFKFLLIGRWEHRKSTTEIIRAFLQEFPTEDVELHCVVDNKFSVDGLNSTEARLQAHGFRDERIKVRHFMSQKDYLDLLTHGDVFVSCSRSEGWNLPLIEALSCGIPSICSDCSGQLEYTKDLQAVFKVRILNEREPKDTYPVGSRFPGMWYEPDFTHLQEHMRYLYQYGRHPTNIDVRNNALRDSIVIGEHFSWPKAAEQAMEVLSDRKESLKVVTVATQQKLELDRLQSSLESQGMELTILGLGSKWGDFISKFKLMKEYVKSLPGDQMVMFLDAYDTYVRGNENEFLTRYKKFGSEIVTGAEVNLHPDEGLRGEYPKSDSVFKYLNSGTYIGSAGGIWSMLDTIFEQYCELPEAVQSREGGRYGDDDQWLMSKYFLDNQDKVKLDVRGKIFQTLHDITEDAVSQEALVLHGNGNGNKLLDELVESSTKRAVFVSVWLGKLPDWIGYFHKSCGLNPDFDWIIASDQYPGLEVPENVHYRYTTKREVELLATKCVGSKVVIGNAYKLCDYKPLYGDLFESMLGEYDYWGFCDLDVVWGDLNRIFSSSMQENRDVITLGGDEKDGLHYRVCGPCTLVRNHTQDAGIV